MTDTEKRAGMISMFEDLAEEASRLTAFAGNELDRRSEQRPDGCLEEALAHHGAAAYASTEGRLLVKFEGEVAEPLFSLDELEPLDPDLSEAVLLGFTRSGDPRLIIRVRTGAEALPHPVKALDHRSVYQQRLLPAAQLGEVAQGASLLAWNQATIHCGFCGMRTQAGGGGYRRHCPACAKEFFPRTDPVVIMLTIDEKNDRCLLGRSPHFRPGMFSCLAGFLEPGETIEDAVRRETLEESGIVLGRVRYHASQPWPFPHSLMIGCYGEAVTGEIRFDGTELDDCRWFSRTKIRDMLGHPPEEGPSVPPEGSIAHRLIFDWCAGR
ncbi:NAD(+) diphosphatase [Chelativorans sp. AA-79]|uniref:NAD(+) diphosphatase n=1 Tax=Chelativorans sp. AA-79 TaxID=3028735 RepID=UPI0023F62884|nr:NAD(+) diphosphatase [Chelativorans sp. AA-79]WEX09743.1 NAD(+) diphosphatase [Chelativorans sp. AA-79]